jgi:hypothetical protein
MNNNITQRRSSSVSPNVSSPSMVIPKREPIENDFVQNNKRRFGEHLSNDTDTILLNKRQMATKKHQYSDNNIQSKFINGRNGSNDEQQQQKQTDSHLSSNNSKMNTQKLVSNDGNIDISSSTNIQSKPR